MYGIKFLIASNFKSSNTWEGANKSDTSSSEENSNVSKTNFSNHLQPDDDYIFDRTDVRAIFITMYTLVFCCCFFGKYFELQFVRVVLTKFINNCIHFAVVDVLILT